MPRSDRFFVTVSPPTFDRTEFSDVDRALAAPQAPFARDWLMARFAEGLEIRMLRPPLEGFVVFQPGRLCWRPIDGVDASIVVHELRVAPGPRAKEAARRLWAVVEGFARYYGYSAALALLGPEDGLISPDLTPGKGWLHLDRGPGDARLFGRILQGPIALPSLPQDWTLRAAESAPGLVVQTTGESAVLEDRANKLERALRRRGVPMTRECFTDPGTARHRATSPGALYSVLLDGMRLGGAELPNEAVLRAVTEARAS